MSILPQECHALCSVTDLHAELSRLQRLSAQSGEWNSMEIGEVMVTLLCFPPSYIPNDLKISLIGFLEGLMTHSSVAQSLAPQVQHFLKECYPSIPLAFDRNECLLDEKSSCLLRGVLELCTASVGSLERSFVLEFVRKISVCLFVQNRMKIWVFEEDERSWKIYEVNLRLLKRIVDIAWVDPSIYGYVQMLVESTVDCIANIASSALDLIWTDSLKFNPKSVTDCIRSAFSFFIRLIQAQRLSEVITSVEEMIIMQGMDDAAVLIVRMIRFLELFEEYPRECHCIVDLLAYFIESDCCEISIMQAIDKSNISSRLRNYLISVCESGEFKTQKRMLDCLLRSLWKQSKSPDVSFGVFMMNAVRESDDNWVIHEVGHSLNSRSIWHFIRDGVVMPMMANETNSVSDEILHLAFQILETMSSFPVLKSIALHQCRLMFNALVQFCTKNEYSSRGECISSAMRLIGRVINFVTESGFDHEATLKARDVLTSGLCFDPLNSAVGLSSIDADFEFKKDLDDLVVVRREAISHLLNDLTILPSRTYIDKCYSPIVYNLYELSDKALEDNIKNRLSTIKDDIPIENLQSDQQRISKAVEKLFHYKKRCFVHVHLLSGWCHVIDAMSFATGVNKSGDLKIHFNLLSSILNILKAGMEGLRCGEYDVRCLVIAGIESLAILQRVVHYWIVSIYDLVCKDCVQSSSTTEKTLASYQLLSERALESVKLVARLGKSDESMNPSPFFRERFYSTLLTLINIYDKTTVMWHRQSKISARKETDQKLRELSSLLPNSDLFEYSNIKCHIQCISLYSRLFNLAPSLISVFIRSGRLSSLISLIASKRDELEYHLYLAHVLLVSLSRQQSSVTNLLPDVFELFKLRILSRGLMRKPPSSAKSLISTYWQTMTSAWILVMQPLNLPVALSTSHLINWINDNEDGILNELLDLNSKNAPLICTMIHVMITSAKDDKLKTRVLNLLEEIMRECFSKDSANKLVFNEQILSAIMMFAYHLQSRDSLSVSLLQRLSKLIIRVCDSWSLNDRPASSLKTIENTPRNREVSELKISNHSNRYRRLCLELYFATLWKWQRSLSTFKRSVATQMQEAGIGESGLVQCINAYKAIADQSKGTNWDCKTPLCLGEYLIKRSTDGDDDRIIGIGLFA
ncbi:hypothetical protein ACOME3_000300 [Neoechinorhynchus agilis]